MRIDEVRSGWIRMDQDGSEWIRIWIRMDQDGSGWIRMDQDMDQDGSGWIRIWIRMRTDEKKMNIPG